MHHIDVDEATGAVTPPPSLTFITVSVITTFIQ